MLWQAATFAQPASRHLGDFAVCEATPGMRPLPQPAIQFGAKNGGCLTKKQREYLMEYNQLIHVNTRYIVLYVVCGFVQIWGTPKNCYLNDKDDAKICIDTICLDKPIFSRT